MAYIGKNPDFNTGTLNPQSVEPPNPVEGMVYYDDGTNRTEGPYTYKDGAWVTMLGAVTPTAYTNGDPGITITSNANSPVLQYSELVPYEVSTGWRLRFNLTYSMAVTGSHSVFITGITYKNTGSVNFAVTATGNNGSVRVEAVAVRNNNNIILTTAATVTTTALSGDIPLDSAPTWL